MAMTRRERIVVCFRYAWCWEGFWHGWWHRIEGAVICFWVGLVSVIAMVLQVVSLFCFPVWRLLIEPLKIGMTCTATQAKNLRKILGR